jgi:prepilin-type N-terminal cleavage/methylation domain-containing protein
MKVFSSDKGFTIIETMVAIAILAVGTLGVASMLVMNFSLDNYAVRTRRAESIGLQKLEDLKVQKTTLTSGSSTDQTYVCKWDVSKYKWSGPQGTNSTLSQIDVIVGWPIGGSCTASTPESCKNRCAMTTFVVNPL